MELSNKALEIKNEYNRLWREKHKEEIRQYYKTWRAEHKDKVAKYNKSYWEKKAQQAE